MINPRKKKRPYLDYDLEGYIKGQQTASRYKYKEIGGKFCRLGINL